MTRPVPITQSMISRAMKVAKREGMTIRVEPSGAIVIVPIPDGAVQDEPVAIKRVVAL